MKKTLTHLPEDKQHQLSRAVDIIVETVKPEMLILFGSYARGDWVDHLEDDGVHYRYQSDMDLLAITQKPYSARRIEFRGELKDRLRREVRTPISLIAEDICFVNARLSKGQYFFVDIYNEGILLHDSGNLVLEKPKKLALSERKKEAQTHFDQWIKMIIEEKQVFKFSYESGLYSRAAFSLHQITERLYSMILLVFTHYKPKIHDLEKLRTMTGSLEPEFLSVFPQSSEFEEVCFERLCQAYVDSRYNPDYHITVEQLDWLAEQVKRLQHLAETNCRAKIASFG